MTKKKSTRISMLLSPALSTEVNSELARARKMRPGLKISRADIVRELLLKGLGDQGLEPYQKGLNEVESIKREAKVALEKGNIQKYKKMCFLVAARELEALSLLQSPAEEQIKSTIMEVLIFIKIASGYKYLPDVPIQKTEIPTNIG